MRIVIDGYAFAVRGGEVIIGTKRNGAPRGTLEDAVLHFANDDDGCKAAWQIYCRRMRITVETLPDGEEEAA